MVIKDRIPHINFVIIVLSGTFILLSILNIKTFTNRTQIKEVGISGDAALLPAVADIQLESVESYKKLFASKKLFRPLRKAKKKKVKVVTVDDLSKNLIVLGTVKQEQPEAVIKNRRTRQTHFVKKGMTLGKLKIEDVTDDKVVVSYNGEKKTLPIR